MAPAEHYEQGQLTEAIQAATEQVKGRPTDTSARGFLAQMLCFAGDLERADAQLETIGHQRTEAALGVALIRQLIRAEQARQQFYSDGRLPEFLEDPPPYLRLHLEAAISTREGNHAQAAELLAQAEQQRPKAGGVCDEQPFEDVRDIDDQTASFLETLTSNGKYYWIPFGRIESIEFHSPEKPLDLLWRRVSMIVRSGPDGEVFLPALYAGSHAEEDDQLRLGRATDWRDGEEAPVRGIGQRLLLVGDRDRPLLEINQLTINQSDVAN